MLTQTLYHEHGYRYMNVTRWTTLQINNGLNKSDTGQSTLKGPVVSLCTAPGLILKNAYILPIDRLYVIFMDKRTVTAFHVALTDWLL